MPKKAKAFYNIYLPLFFNILSKKNLVKKGRLINKPQNCKYKKLYAKAKEIKKLYKERLQELTTETVKEFHVWRGISQNKLPDDLICEVENCQNLKMWSKPSKRLLEVCTCRDEEHQNLKKLSKVKNQKKAFLEKYGTENPMHLEEIKEKLKKTNMQRYGVEWVAQNEAVKEKIKKTNLKKYGVPVSSQSQEVKEKAKKTYLRKYNVTNPMHVSKFKEKIKETNLKRYGVLHPNQQEKNRQSISKKNKEKAEQAKTKRQETNLKKYGVIAIAQCPQIKQRLRNKWPRTHQKLKETFLKKYNAEYYTQSKHYKNRSHEIKEKTVQTNLQKYKAKSFKQIHLKNTHLLTKEYLIENFLDENGGIKLQEMMDFYNMKETACYRYMRENDIRINYKAGGFNPNEPGILYYLLDQETGLYKIGVTNKSVGERFPNSDGSKRNMIILEQTYYENGYEALEAEQEILEAFSYCRCTNESWPEAWGGRTEFFKEDILLKDKICRRD